MDLSREPLLRDRPIPGGRISRMWQGPVNSAGVGIEVSELELDQNPTPGRLRQAWTARRAGQARPVIVFAAIGTAQVLICGPDGAPPPVTTIPADTARRVFETLLAELPGPATRRAIDLLGRALGSGAVPGFRNRSLVSTHYVTKVIRRPGRTEWSEGADHGDAALGQRGESLLRSLGYDLETTAAKEYRVHDGDVAVALAHIYDSGTSLDRVTAGHAAPPAALALKRARELGLDHAILVAGSLIRIYSLQAIETLDEGAPSAAYVEFDTELLPAEFAPLLGALAAPDAMRTNGRLHRLRTASGRYAVDLRERFAERLYESVVDRLVRGIDAASRLAGVEPRPNEEELYRTTLVLLFRLLFLLYAEDRDLLPMNNSEYEAHSITGHVQSAARLAQSGRDFDERATSIWAGLIQLFRAVAEGNADWGVPPYNGGLFTEDGLDGGLLRRIELPNAVLGPALVALGWDDEGPDGEIGKIDFGDLGVRHLGTIYEGLLSYEVAFATQNLRIDRRAEGEPYVAAGPDETFDVPVGAPHIRSPQGGRKATGSYYTPVFAVDRLVEKALLPALEDHLGQVGPSQDVSTALLLDFRVADIAMGSGHFLVAALDALTERLASHLAAHPNAELRAELERARQRLNDVGDRYGAPQLGERVADLDLLRRILLKRCIYGVDYNAMAVELARLSLWLHSLVPGLPLSYLGANLQHGNSLVGIGTEVSTLGIFTSTFDDQAAAKAAQVESIDDLELGDIARGEELEQELRGLTSGLRDYYDVITAAPLLERDLREIELHAEAIIAGTAPTRVQNAVGQAREAARAQVALHWRLAFPSVFLRRERPGFDVILGNPPWEEVKTERLGFFERFLPRLRAEKTPAARERRIAAFAETYVSINDRFEREGQATESLRRYLKSQYHLTQSGDPDLYKAFSERFLSLVRDGGRLGIVLPRGAFVGDGTGPFREALFNASRETSMDALKNRNGWIFPDVAGQYTVVLLSAWIDPNGTRSLSVSALTGDRDAFERIDDGRIEWSVGQLREADAGLAVPLLPTVSAARLYQRLVTTIPKFASTKGGWHAVPWTELHGTKDRENGLMKEPGTVSGEAWPVYGGRSFDLWAPEAWKENAGLQYVLEPEIGLAELQKKRQRSSVWSAFPPSMLRDPSTLPMHRPRILYRQVARATDSRTVIACLVPPHVFAHNAAPSLIWPSGDARDVAYLLGVMASVPFDWLARRRVEANLNFFILNGLPVPRPNRDDLRWQRVVAIAGRLACPDERFGAFAADVGLVPGPVDAKDKSLLCSELDALVSVLYGFTPDDLALVFEDFAPTAAAVPLGRRVAAIEFLKQWSS